MNAIETGVNVLVCVSISLLQFTTATFTRIHDFCKRSIITNEGAITHEFVLEFAGAHDEPFEKEGKVSEAEDIEPGTSTSLEWMIDKPGEYQVACYFKVAMDDMRRDSP